MARPAPARLAPLIGWCAVVLFLLLGASYARPLTFQAATPALEALPRETVNLALQLENTGNTPWRGLPELKLPPGWRAILEPGEVTLGPSERYLALFTVLVSAGAEAGEYSLPVSYTDPAGTAFSAAYTVRVQEVRGLETALLEAPPYVVAAPYTARFSLRNAGNRPEEVALQARDSLSLPLSTRPARVRLAPGDAVEVAVTAGVSTDLSQSQRHHLYLEARARDDAEVSSLAAATVELIPRSLSEASAYHLFPLKVRLGQLRTGMQAAPDHFGGFNLSLAGAGQLWDEDPGTLDLQLSVGSSRTGAKNLVSYEAPGFQVAAGEQSLSLSPLTASRSGLGLSAQHSFGLGTGDRLEAQAFVYRAPTNTGVGVHASAALGPLFEFGAYSLVSEGPYGTVAGGELRLHPELEGFSKLNLETEYSLQTDTGGRGFRLGGEAEVGGSALSAGWQQAQAGFQGAAADGYTLELSGSLRLYEASSTYASAHFNQKVSYLPGELLIASPETLERSWSGRFATAALGVGWSLQYEHIDSVGAAETLTRTKRELTFGVSSSISDDVLLTQNLSWLRAFGSAASDEALGYEVGAYVPLERGSLLPRAGGKYSLLAGRLSKALLGLGWYGLVGEGDSVALDLEGDLEFSDNRSVGLLATGTYGFANGQALDVDLSGRAYYSSRESDLKLSLGYNVPLELPLNRLSNVGEVKGKFEDESGAGISGLIVQVAGLSVITAEDGSFTFPAVPEGDHLLVVTAAGALADKITVPALPHSVRMSAGETVKANFRVIREAAVAGQVRFVQTENDHGAPPTGPGNVVIFGDGRPDQDAGLVANLVVELRNGNTTLRARTDAEGRFEFRGLFPGAWHLTVLRSELSERYRLEPETQELVVRPGTSVRAEVELIPVARTIQFMEGGTLSTP